MKLWPRKMVVWIDGCAREVGEDEGVERWGAREVEEDGGVDRLGI